MKVTDLTDDNAKRILNDIVAILATTDDWNADTFDEITLAMQCDQGKLWPPDTPSISCPNCETLHVQLQGNGKAFCYECETHFEVTTNEPRQESKTVDP